MNPRVDARGNTRVDVKARRMEEQKDRNLHAYVAHENAGVTRIRKKFGVKSLKF